MSTTSETQRQQQAELHKKLWAMANDLRGQMDASEFKDYILGLIFYRYLSEKVEARANVLLIEDHISFAEAWKNEEYREDLSEYLIDELGYVVEPQFLFSYFLEEIKKGANGNFDVEMLQNGVKAIESSTLGTDSQNDFQNLFDDMDLTSSRLGRTVKDRSHLISKVIVNIADIPFEQDNAEIDILGDAYEYMISQFAANAGKKAGEFYTPQQVSKILAKIVTAGKLEIRDVYDGTCGSGSLLLRVGKEAKVHKYYGQEKVSTTYNLARMNMLLHDIPYQRFDIRNADTLEDPQHLEKRFEAIVANPPYSAKWSADDKFIEDERFSAYAKLAPKSKADFAFIQHYIHQLDENGTLAVVLPHGVLFRGGAEGVIRKYLIEEKNYLDAVIGLPANIFFGTDIPTCILVFKKCRKLDDHILFLEASDKFEKGNKQNYLTDTHVDEIINAYLNRKNVEQFSYLATIEEIKNNDYLLNILAYVKLNQQHENIDPIKEIESLEVIENQIKQVNLKLDMFLTELGIPNFDLTLMNKVLRGELRFKNADGNTFPNWQETKLSSILTETKLKSSGNLRICSVAVKKGVVDQIEHLGRSYAAENTSNYNRVCYGDIVYTKSPTGEFPYGIIKQSQLKEDVAVSPLYGVFKPKNYYLGFILHSYFMYAPNANNYLAPIIQKGAKNTINITNDTFLSKSIKLPQSEEEQIKISNFLFTFDEKINLEIKKATHWENTRKGLFLKMFE